MNLTNAAISTINQFAKSNKVSREKLLELVGILVQNPLIQPDVPKQDRISEKTESIQAGIIDFSENTPIFTTKDVCDTFGINNAEANRILRQMEHHNMAATIGKHVGMKKVGPRFNQWVVTY